MASRDITSDGVVLARIVTGDWPTGLAFYSKDEEFIQAGTWGYDAGKELLAHTHNSVPRHFEYTQEVVYVRKGRLKVRVYDLKRELVETVELSEGDTVIMLRGGHGYDILEDGTQVLEVKNGPYMGAEKDRTRY
jgi:quercetin dioxygenase-like cupin family protein